MDSKLGYDSMLFLRETNGNGWNCSTLVIATSKISSELIKERGGGTVNLLVNTFFVKRSPNLSTAKDKSLDFFMRFDLVFIFLMSSIPKNAMETAVITEIFKRRSSERMTQQRFREEEDQRLSEFTVDLTTKNVEDVGRRSAVNNLHVAILMLTVDFVFRWEHTRIFVAQLQETFNTSAGMFRSLTVVTMWQGQN